MPWIETEEEFYDHLMKGDDRCPIKKGEMVEKVWADLEGDHHPIGAKGKVVGSIFADGLAAYMVHFEGDEQYTFIAGVKVNKITNS